MGSEPVLEIGEAPDAFDDLVLRQLELRLAVQGARADEYVNALLLRRLQRFERRIDIAVRQARERADGRPFDFARNGSNSRRIAGRSGRKARFNDINIQVSQCASDDHFGVDGHGEARRLLAVAQGRVKDFYVVYVRYCIRSHFSSLALIG